MPNTFYITTTLPYVNAEPHIGFGLEIVKADAIARYHKLIGDTVVFNTGTDEHGQKIYQKALEEGKDPQTYCDEYAAKFGDLKKLLDLNYTHFIRTTDAHHIAAAQEFWKRCDEHGYIYKKLYKVKYCVGCELEKTDSELVDGKCPLHPNKELEIREEENYFFKFSAFQQQLLDLYTQDPEFVVPSSKLNEIQSFVTQGLQDFSISRLASKMPWGVPVPTDSEHVMYVWFDALVNYISTIGWPSDQQKFSDFWPAVQICGKDNLRQQSAMWQAMLMAAKLPPSKKILINGFISVDGQKMSKSLGNVISPTELVARYGVDGTRYLLIGLGSFGDDADVSWDKFDATYSSELANGLGNLVSRVAALCEKTAKEFPLPQDAYTLRSEIKTAMTSYDLRGALTILANEMKELDKTISEKEPWKMEIDPLYTFLTGIVEQVRQISVDLEPFTPGLAKKIQENFLTKRINKITPLFPRLTARG